MPVTWVKPKKPRKPAVRHSLMRRGPVPLIEDVELQGKLLGYAVTMTRGGAAAMCGIDRSVLDDAIKRGKAFPEDPVFGPFSRAYLMAERGLEHEATTLRGKMVRKMADAAKQGNWTLVRKIGSMADLDRLLESRWPQDHGTSKHRVPEPELNGREYLEQVTITHGQLCAVLREPYESLRLALLEVFGDIPAMVDRLSLFKAAAPALPDAIETKGESN